ncbi:hypothetical protein SUDANB6_00093 [Streptomyces sp. enrichment culture]|uniref:hypothetical protein n=1 Tax=Streptomyces sp. enrichment culture TaxID=1795815 RepID=UPI003F55FEB5
MTDGLGSVRAPVTGGASGTGLATAQPPASRGTAVACPGPHPHVAPAPLPGVWCGVTDDTGVRAAADRAADVPGGPDVVGDAGAGARGTVEDNRGGAAGLRVSRG